jgi:flagellar biosynthetic protein FliQ
MNGASAFDLFAQLLRVTAFIAGPPLVTALVAGLVVGIFQAATQINEASLSFLVKVVSVVAVLVGVGPTIVSYAVDYTRGSFAAIEHVVRE